MEEKIFRLGPIQEAWLKSLEEHPERQGVKRLGKKNSEGLYTACCLGEGGLIAGVYEWDGSSLVTVTSADKSYNNLDFVYESLGLYDGVGSNFNGGKCLTRLNDTATTWPEIAAMIRANPEQWLKESK